MNKLIIREINIEDLNDLAIIYCKSFNVYNAGKKWAWTQESSYELLKYWFDKPQGLRFLAQVGDRIMGAFVTEVRPSWDRNNHLVDGEIFIDPEFQNKGIGSELMRVVFEAAIEKYDAKSFYSNTFKNSEHPLRWYKKLGFVEVNDVSIISGNLKEVVDKLK